MPVIFLLVPCVLQAYAVFHGNLPQEPGHGGIAVNLVFRCEQRMVVRIVGKVLSCVALGDDVIGCQIQEQSHAARVAIKAFHNGEQPRLPQQLPYDQVVPDPEAAATFRTVIFQRELCFREILEEVWVRVHPGRFLGTGLPDSGPLGGVVLLFRMVHPRVLIQDVRDPVLFLPVNFARYVGYRHRNVIVHTCLHLNN